MISGLSPQHRFIANSYSTRHDGWNSQAMWQSPNAGRPPCGTGGEKTKTDVVVAWEDSSEGGNFDGKTDDQQQDGCLNRVLRQSRVVDEDDEVFRPFFP